MKVAIVGGGPIGVEAALYGACAGFDVHLYEQACLAANVRRWGHVRVFTQWERNRSPLARRMLREAGVWLAPDDSTSSGDELAEYVERLAEFAQLKGRVHAGTQVLSLTREGCLKGDFADAARRARCRFRLDLRSAGVERVEHADVAIDATGVYATPNWMGNGGAPCPGEARCAPWIDYSLPDVLGHDRERFVGRHTLVVGSGHSAASTLRSIAELFDAAPETRVTWVVRRDVPAHGAPYTLIENDPSPHRNELHRRANQLAADARVEFAPRTTIESVELRGGKFEVEVRHGGGPPRTISCDNIAAHTGFRADNRLWQELRMQEHPATGGVYGLSEMLIENNRRIGVGLSTGYAEKTPATPVADAATEHAAAPDRWQVLLNDPELLRNEEPNFFVIGIKSYGRDAGFLMQNGFRQTRDVFKLLSREAGLDLYEGELD